MSDKMKTQGDEFKAADDFATAMRAINTTAVVDDDYPQVRHRYEAALRRLIAAMKANGRDFDSQSALTFTALRDTNVKRCEKWHPEGIGSWSPSDWLTAVMGELGELASEVKMFNRERDGLVSNKTECSPQERQRRMAKEAADVVIYLDLFCAERGIDLGDAIVRKFNEVSERVGFPDRLCVDEAKATG